MAAEQALARLDELHEEGKPDFIFGFLRRMNPYAFEELVLSAYKRSGYRIVRNRSYSGDGGIDGRVYDGAGNLMLVQSKRYRKAINPKHVRAFSELVRSDPKAIGGFFVHTGRTGKKSWMQSGEGVTIVSGPKLIDLLKQKRIETGNLEVSEVNPSI